MHVSIQISIVDILGNGLLKDIYLKTHRVNVYASKHNKKYKAKFLSRLNVKKLQNIS
jgi:hypothetical protein